MFSFICYSLHKSLLYILFYFFGRWAKIPKITRHFMAVSQQESPKVEDVCATLATVMAHGCNIGPYTMSHLTEGISYNRIKHITDWMLTEDAQRGALAR
jgi:hypothetical protein